MKHSLLVALLAVPLAFLPACRSASPITTYLIDENSSEIDKTKAGFLGIRGLDLVSVNHERRDGRLFVQAQVRNTTGSHLELEHSVEWSDQNGFLIGEPTPWKGTNLGRGELYTLTFTGPKTEATRMRLNLRRRDAVR
jgi:uncharacterized protein YcfL